MGERGDEERDPVIENTAKRDPLLHLAAGMTDTADYIMGMEADGQRQIVAAIELMPTEGPWADLRALGFGVPEQTDDELFVRTTLPDGWQKQATDHSMWSTVVDERGVERVAVFYKAAFYDRRAFCRISNVGRGLASKAAYSEPGDPHYREPGKPDQWDVLTEGERADYVAELDSYLRLAQEHPSIYGDRVERVNALKAAVTQT